MAKKMESNDLPMSANISDISLRHFVLDLNCRMEEHVMYGSITLFFCPITALSSKTDLKGDTADSSTDGGSITYSSSTTVQNLKTKPECDGQVNTGTISTDSDLFVLVLDCNKLIISGVEGIHLSENEKDLLQQDVHMFAKFVQESKFCMEFSERIKCKMGYTLEEHCVRIWMDGVYSIGYFPQAIKIWYRTSPDGPSLKWTLDQDGKPCVFTIGHVLNNRSLFPSQDAPNVLLTWYASMTVKKDLIALVTGDRERSPSHQNPNGCTTFSFASSFFMPCSTFAVAIGYWQSEVLPARDWPTVDRPWSLRLFFPAYHKVLTTTVLADYLSKCFLEIQIILGAYPLCRLDILIVPACFDSLGLASPNLLFVSQSILTSDGSMCIKLAHELCHIWFGILTGPQDWSEEWITEGFCTYLESILHSNTWQQMGHNTESYLELHSVLNYRLLKAELGNTDPTLQILRPNRGEDISSTQKTGFLKNGMNPEKNFMQVHYLKGFFLLHHLENWVGRAKLLSFLKEFLQKFIWKLFTSQDFLQMFFSKFPELSAHGHSVEELNSDWLDCPGLPQALGQVYGDSGLSKADNNQLMQEVMLQLTEIKALIRRKRKKGQGKPGRLPKLLPIQVLVLLEALLDEVHLPLPLMQWIEESHGLTHFENAEVCHRWCELIIKHRHQKLYHYVPDFLTKHQAMGIYLYGEAMISQCPHLIQMVRECFRSLKEDMPQTVCQAITDIIFVGL